MVGKCRLCLRENVELKRSHYISAAVYRTLRGAAAPGMNPDPFHVPCDTGKELSNVKTGPRTPTLFRVRAAFFEERGRLVFLGTRCRRVGSSGSWKLCRPVRLRCISKVCRLYSTKPIYSPSSTPTRLPTLRPVFSGEGLFTAGITTELCRSICMATRTSFADICLAKEVSRNARR